jgi:hypothetical protein
VRNGSLIMIDDLGNGRGIHFNGVGNHEKRQRYDRSHRLTANSVDVNCSSADQVVFVSS